MDQEPNTMIDSQPAVDETLHGQEQPDNVAPMPNAEESSHNAAPAPAVDPAQIAQIAAQTALETQRQSQTQLETEFDPEKLSPEERAEYFKTFNVTEDFAQGFVGALQPDDEGNVPIQKVSSAIEQLRDGIVAQSMRHTELALQQQQQQFEQQFTPVQQAYQKQQAEQVWNNYASKYPHHKDYQDLVDSTASQLRQSGFQPANAEQLFDTVAKTVDATIKRINPQYAPPAQANGSALQQSSSSSPQMTGIAMGQAPSAPTQKSQNTNEFFDSDVLG